MNAFFEDVQKQPVGIPKIPTHIQHPEEITQFGETWLWTTFGLMSLGALIFFVLAQRASYRFRALHVTNFFICSIAAVAYFCMASGLGKTLVHSDPHNRSSTREVFYARYIDWLLTTPLLLLDLTLISGLPKAETLVVLGADVFMIVTGLLAALHPSLRFRWGLYAFSCLAFIYVVLQLVTSARSYAFLRSPKVGNHYNQIALSLAIVWTIYPIVWGFAEGTGKISVDNEVLIFAIIDVIAKPVWGLWIVLALPEEGHVLLPESWTAPVGSVSGGNYGSIPSHDDQA